MPRNYEDLPTEELERLLDEEDEDLTWFQVQRIESLLRRRREREVSRPRTAEEPEEYE